MDDHHRSAPGTGNPPYRSDDTYASASGRSPARHNAIVLSAVGAVTAALLLTVILAIANDGNTASTTSASESATLDPRDQSIYDDGYRVGLLDGKEYAALPSDLKEQWPDPTESCNGMTQGTPGMRPSAVQVDLYDYDDLQLWITGCVDGYEAAL
ncbi:hypothetical protein [Gordonia terrae]